MMAATNKEEDDVRMGAQALCAGEHSFEFVRAAEISRIANNKAPFESPLAPQRIVSMCYWEKVIIVSPVGDHMDALGGCPERFHALGHEATNDHIGLRSF